MDWELDQLLKLWKLLERLTEFAQHKDWCDIFEGEGLPADCTCGFLSLMIEVQDARS